MSGIGGHVNRADRARRRDHALVDRIRRWQPDNRLAEILDNAPDLDAFVALAHALDVPLFDWQYRFAAAVLAPRHDGRTALQSWHAPGTSLDWHLEPDPDTPIRYRTEVLGYPDGRRITLNPDDPSAVRQARGLPPE